MVYHIGQTCSYFNALRMYDEIDSNNLGFMFKVNNNLLPYHMLSYCEIVCDSHNNNTCNRNTNYKIKSSIYQYKNHKKDSATV